MDYLSSLNLAGASSQPLAGAKDLAQNPFNLAAEHGPAFTDADLSLIRSFRLSEAIRLQARAESFNIANRANLGLPVGDLNSPNFGRILSAGAPQLMQFALKLTY